MSDLKAAFDFLRKAAFYDMPLPKRIRLERKPLKHAWGYYYDTPKIEIDSSIKTGDRLLRVMAHEMVHATLEKAGAFDTSDHGEAFKAIAHTVCQRMGWRSI